MLMEMGGGGNIADVAARSEFTQAEALQLIETLIRRNLIDFDGDRVWIPPGEADHVAGLVRVWCRSRMKPHCIRDCVLEILANRGPLTVRGLADAAGASYKAVSKAVTALEAEGKVEKVPAFRAGGRRVVRICGDCREPATSTTGNPRPRRRGRREWLTWMAGIARNCY